MSRTRWWLPPAVLAAAGVIGYLVGLLVRQLDADRSPWAVALGMTVSAAVVLATLRRNTRHIDALKADPRSYVQSHRLAEDNRLLPKWLLAGNLFITAVLVSVYLLTPGSREGYLVEGVFLLAEAALWGSLIWVWTAVRRQVNHTGRRSTASGGGRVARAGLVLDCRYAETRQAVDLALADQPAYRLLAESGRTLWLATNSNSRTLVLELELASAGQGTELNAVSFPLGRFANNTAWSGAHALTTILDAVAHHAPSQPSSSTASEAAG